MEYKTCWGHWGNTGSWLKAPVVLPRRTQLTLGNTNRKCAAATCCLFMLWRDSVTVSLTGNKLKKQLTPSYRGQSSWKLPRSRRGILGGRRPDPKWEAQVWRHSSLNGCGLIAFAVFIHEDRWGLIVPSGNISITFSCSFSYQRSPKRVKWNSIMLSSRDEQLSRLEVLQKQGSGLDARSGAWAAHRNDIKNKDFSF